MKKIHLPQKTEIAAFDVDCQKTFTPLCPDELPVPEGDQIVEELNAQAQKASLRVGSKDAHNPKAIWVANDKQPAFEKLNYEQADTAWPVHAVPGTRGFELLDGLPKITDYDFFVWKGVELDIHPYGACYHDLHDTISTGVIEFLKQKGITTVLVGGLATDYCVRATVLQLLNAGFHVIVNRAATRGVSPEDTEKAFQAFEKNRGTVVETTEALIEAR